MLIFLFWIILLRKYEQIPKLKIKMGSFSNPDEKIKILGKRINAQKINLWFSFGKIRFNVFMKNVKPIKLKKEKNTAWTKYILFETIPIIALILIISLDSLKIVDLYDESQWFILIKFAMHSRFLVRNFTICIINSPRTTKSSRTTNWDLT